MVRDINEQQEEIKDDLASGMRDVRDGIKKKMRTIDVTMLKELKKLRISARKEIKKHPFGDTDAASGTQVGGRCCMYYHYQSSSAYE